MDCCFETLTDKDLENGVHLSGIGGVGMSALAEMLYDLGIKVTGSDLSFSKNIQRLEKLGIRVYLEHKKEHVKGALVCRTRAVKDDNPEVIYAKKVVYRSLLLQFLAKDKKQLVVTGSHGKTTVSALLSHCMIECGFNPSFAVGGLCSNLNRYGKISSGEYFIIEGDESDGSHLKTNPFGAILTSADVDHLAFWKKGENLIASYKTFAKSIQNSQYFIYNGEDEQLKAMELKGKTFGWANTYDYFAEDIELDYLSSKFKIKGKQVVFPMFGDYNIKNAVAVFALLDSLCVDHQKIISAFASFKGVDRRMEYLGGNIYTDYAHHPEEVKSVLKTISKVSADIQIIFEPHRLSRFNDEIENFCKVFKGVVITDVFEASEGLDIKQGPLIERFCKQTESRYIPLEEIHDYLKMEKRIVLGIGAGSLDRKLRTFIKRDV
jgi:UDP-N-acetylmuramate--alanine ligase